MQLHYSIENKLNKTSKKTKYRFVSTRLSMCVSNITQKSVRGIATRWYCSLPIMPHVSVANLTKQSNTSRERTNERTVVFYKTPISYFRFRKAERQDNWPTFQTGRYLPRTQMHSVRHAFAREPSTGARDHVNPTTDLSSLTRTERSIYVIGGARSRFRPREPHEKLFYIYRLEKLLFLPGVSVVSRS